MAAEIQTHSRLVYWLKIILPIVALAILSTMFLFGRNINIERSLPYAQVEIDRLAADPRLSAPEYSGVTDDGAAVNVAASTARPGKNAADPVSADDIVALYEALTGEKVTIHSKSGQFDSGAGLLTLTGEVVVTTADGFQITSDKMQSLLKQSLITADRNVVATAPFGKIEAGAMRLSGPASQHLLIFDKGVKLVYSPED